MINFLKAKDPDKLSGYYEEIKHEKHIFIYSVCGRTSSTALQRILNSSDRVCIYGEPHYLVDDIIKLLNDLKKLDRDFKKRRDLAHFDNLKKSFRTGDHTLIVENAIRDLEEPISLLKSALATSFRPVNNVKRSGFKEIRIRSVETLAGLKELFPKSCIIFFFRDPLEQWRSIKAFGRHDYPGDVFYKMARNIDLFLEEYDKLATIYMKFSADFIENKLLFDKEKLYRLLHFLGIDHVDESLIGNKIRETPNKKEITHEENKKILDSKAYRDYQKMVELSKKFISKIS